RAEAVRGGRPPSPALLDPGIHDHRPPPRARGTVRSMFNAAEAGKGPVRAIEDLGKEPPMPALKQTKTHENLKHAFAGESQANRRYLYFARRADIEGYPDVGGLFRDTSEAETGHAFGHLDFLKEVGDPCTGVPIGTTSKNLKSA